MDSFASATSLRVTRWRTATIIASAVAALELCILLVIGTAVLGRTVAHNVRAAAVNKVAGTPAPQQRPGLAAPKLARSETGVFVLNGNGVAGAAATTAEHVRGLGYLVAGVGNAHGPSPHTIVMYKPGFRAEAKRLAHDTHAGIVTPLDGMRTRDLMGAQLALVIGA